MKLIFENWRKHLNEGGAAGYGHYEPTTDVMDDIEYDVRDLMDAGMKPRQIFNNLMSRRKDLQGKGEEVKAAIARLLNAEPQRFDDPTGQARLEEAEYDPGRAVANIDTGEERMSPKDVAEEDVRDLAEKFDVEAFVETASDGKTAILVFHQGGEPVAYNDTEEMYQDLASRQEMNEGAVPHSAHHVVKRMMKTGKSALAVLTDVFDIPEKEAKRWLERHKDEMTAAKKDLAKDRK